MASHLVKLSAWNKGSWIVITVPGALRFVVWWPWRQPLAWKDFGKCNIVRDAHLSQVQPIYNVLNLHLLSKRRRSRKVHKQSSDRKPGKILFLDSRKMMSGIAIQDKLTKCTSVTVHRREAQCLCFSSNMRDEKSICSTKWKRNIAIPNTHVDRQFTCEQRSFLPTSTALLTGHPQSTHTWCTDLVGGIVASGPTGACEEIQASRRVPRLLLCTELYAVKCICTEAHICLYLRSRVDAEHNTQYPVFVVFACTTANFEFGRAASGLWL